MENYDKTKFTQFELNIIELFERLQSATVTAEENGIYYTDDGYENGYTKGALLEHCLCGINHWYSETDTEDMLNNDFILENTLDYLQLLLTLPSDTTILAVGNGSVAAPSTTTAYLHEDYHNNKLLAVYDYEDEDNTKAMKRDLCELFPKEPPTIDYMVRLENRFGQYNITMNAENEAEAIQKAFAYINDNSDVPMNDWKNISVQTKAEAKAEEPEKPKADYTELIAVANYEIRKAINKTMNHFTDSYTVTENLSDSQAFELDIATNHITYAVADSIAETLKIK